jgi:hypothetical protein
MENADIFYRKPSPFTVHCEDIQQGEGLVSGFKIMKLQILF